MTILKMFLFFDRNERAFVMLLRLWTEGGGVASEKKLLCISWTLV